MWDFGNFGKVRFRSNPISSEIARLARLTEISKNLINLGFIVSSLFLQLSKTNMFFASKVEFIRQGISSLTNPRVLL